MTDQLLYLLSAGGSEPAVTLGQGLPPTINGKIAHYRWSDALQIGQIYKHPSKGFEVDASEENVKKIEDSFSKMKSRGVAVPLVADHSLKAIDAMGHAVDTRRKNGWLQVLLCAVGDDSDNVLAKNKISLGLKSSYKDGKGNSYPLAMEHVGVTPIPVVTGQGELLTLSAVTAGDYLLTGIESAVPAAEPAEQESKDMSVILERLERIEAKMQSFDLSAAPKLARCIGCGSHDVTRQAAMNDHEGPMDECDNCGRVWPHKPGTITARQMGGDEAEMPAEEASESPELESAEAVEEEINEPAANEDGTPRLASNFARGIFGTN